MDQETSKAINMQEVPGLREETIKRLSRSLGFNIESFPNERIDQIIAHFTKYPTDENHLKDSLWTPMYWDRITNPTPEITYIQKTKNIIKLGLSIAVDVPQLSVVIPFGIAINVSYWSLYVVYKGITMPISYINDGLLHT